MSRSRLALALAVAAGCGSTGDAGGGAAHLPVSGAGPFRPLASDPAIPISAPFVLVDPAADLDEPTVLARGEQLAIWVTVKPPGAGAVTTIEHADVLTRLTDGFGALYPALQADRSWEAGGVSGPSVVWDGGSQWILFYAAGGAIGWAVGTDPLGHLWQKAPGPALIADVLEEGNLLGPPAAVRVTDGSGDRLRVYYPAQGVLWAAEAPYADVLAGRAALWTRLDGDPATPARDPMVAGAPFAASVGRAQAQARATAAGRLRHDLYFTAFTGGVSPSTCGFAASFSGDRFAITAQPILPPSAVATRSPAMTPYEDGAALFYVERLGGRDAIAAATQP